MRFSGSRPSEPSQLAIQAATDIANHVLAEDTDVTPEDYGAAFRALVPLGIVEPFLAERLASAAGLRNILVHICISTSITSESGKR